MRRLTATLLALVLAALALWVSTRLVWLRADFRSPLRGTVGIELTGAQVRPELTGIALLALAAVAAMVATAGWPRRAFALLVTLAGVWVVWLGSTWLATDTIEWLRTASLDPRPPVDAVLSGRPERTSAALLALVAGLLLGSAGAAAAWWANAMPRLGGRYTAPGTRRVDRDSEWWNALDAGEDPTLKGPRGDPGT